MGRPSTGEWELFQKSVWNKPSFIELSPAARVLYLWGWTSPDATLSGIVSASPRKLLRAIGADVELGDVLDELARKPLALYDDDDEILWIVGRVEHVSKSPKVRVRVVREYEACPSEEIRRRFLAEHGARLDLNGAHA